MKKDEKPLVDTAAKDGVRRIEKIGSPLSPTLPPVLQTKVDQYRKRASPLDNKEEASKTSSQAPQKPSSSQQPTSKKPTTSRLPVPSNKPSQGKINDTKRTATVAGKAPRKGPAADINSAKEGRKSAHESKATQQASERASQKTSEELLQEQRLRDEKFRPRTVQAYFAQLAKLRYGRGNTTSVQNVLKNEPAVVQKSEAPEFPKGKGKEPPKSGQTSQGKANASQVKGQETAKSGKTLDDRKLKAEGNKPSDTNGKKRVTTNSAKAKEPKPGEKRARAADDEERRSERDAKKQKVSESVTNTKEARGPRETKEVKETKLGVKRPRPTDEQRPTERATKKLKIPDQVQVKKEPKAGDKRARPAIEDEKPSEPAAKKQKQTERLEMATKKSSTPTGSSLKSPTPSNVGGSQKSSNSTASVKKDIESSSKMKRVESSESHVATPQVAKTDVVASTTQALTSGGISSRPVSEGPTGGNDAAREAFKAKRSEGFKYNDLGKTIKVQAEKLLKAKLEEGATATSEGAALGIQSLW